MSPRGMHRETQGLDAGATLRSRYCCCAVWVGRPGSEPRLHCVNMARASPGEGALGWEIEDGAPVLELRSDGSRTTALHTVCWEEGSYSK